uniref:Toxin ICK-20 n=1 Tax=Trittame loki TaxID=1295018 RepID=ICK20_TRILK|nr:RecName: Full=Toxin ICK-20; Flags: Precursor [Trittame loki]
MMKYFLVLCLVVLGVAAVQAAALEDEKFLNLAESLAMPEESRCKARRYGCTDKAECCSEKCAYPALTCAFNWSCEKVCA